MFDGFWSGLLGGLLGPAAAQLMSRFRYWVIFGVVTVGVYVGLFILMTYSKGLNFAIGAFIKNLATPTGILVPMGIGLLAVFVAFVGSLNSSRNNNKEDRERK